MGPMESYLNKPLTSREEARLSTLGNCITLACFRPIDTCRAVIRDSHEKGKIQLVSLWRGWPKQAFNKVLDDEIFNTNIRRVNKFVEETFNYKNPSGSTYGRAAVGTAARILTLTVMVPYYQLSDPAKRKILMSKRSGQKTAFVTVTPFYTGFEKSLIKESIFTASYVILSSYFGNAFAKYRPRIAGEIDKRVPSSYQDETKQKLTDVALASMKAAAAGVCASLLSQPVDMVGKGIPVSTQITSASRKAFRKGAYNGLNTMIVQALYTHKIHRRLFWNVASPFEDTPQQVITTNSKSQKK
eukprot:Gregarina_sp_Poly_1__11468@NODE_985_length_5470_cov_797_213215_g692_i0_p3_GENE_NODE_985_length_5470_cov_797_213215_g692_i0NODE_985_length_5470_cov_797_213215_g692_i0_p3_ORF_typecomplete_len300_score43_43Mito_carr/PF00153_27/9_3e02Mito_carr/PF00153_27/45Mito_carr/PF00153_27/0_61_NODE_985_length_5470_cov_797_213215_g692_i01251024